MYPQPVPSDVRRVRLCGDHGGTRAAAIVGKTGPPSGMGKASLAQRGRTQATEASLPPYPYCRAVGSYLPLPAHIPSAQTKGLMEVGELDPPLRTEGKEEEAQGADRLRRKPLAVCA